MKHVIDFVQLDIQTTKKLMTSPFTDQCERTEIKKGVTIKSLLMMPNTSCDLVISLTESATVSPRI